MEQWHYDPAANYDAALTEQLRVFPPGLDTLVRMVRLLAAVVLRCWLRVYHRVTIIGRHNLPAEGPFILVANHASHLDTLCLLAALPLSRLHCTFPVAAKDYFCVNGLRAVLATVVVNALPFDRLFAPWQSLSVCAHLLERPDTILILFPEGTRSGGLAPEEFKPGVALLAASCGIPVVSCHLAGTHAALPKGAWCPRPRAVRLTIGAPHVYPHLPATKESAKQICRELREAVMLLGKVEPEEFRVRKPAPRKMFQSPVLQP